MTALYQCWTDVSSVTIVIMRKRRSVLIATSEAPLPSVMLYTNTYTFTLVHIWQCWCILNDVWL